MSTEITTIIGVDPGMVHTGVVAIGLMPGHKQWAIEEYVIDGPDSDEVARAAKATKAHVFIEGYRSRSHFAHDARMIAAVSEMRKAIPGAQVIFNTGVKQVVSQELMHLFGVWKFTTATHHQDLRSAARIGIYGALKDPELNAMLYEFAVDHLDGEPWTRA